MGNENFDKWNELKKRLHKNGKVAYFRERQIWWCSVGQNVGFEVYGKGESFGRPVLIFKKLTGDTFIGIPLTSKDKEGTWYVKIRHKGKEINLMLHQIRVFDKKRLIDRFGEIDDNDFSKIRSGIKNLFDLTNIHPALRRESMGKSQK